jgi:hypothetical protein
MTGEAALQTIEPVGSASPAAVSACPHFVRAGRLEGPAKTLSHCGFRPFKTSLDGVGVTVCVQ